MGDGQRRADQKRGRGQGLWIILVLLLLLVAGGVGYLVGRGNAPEPGSALPTRTGTSTPTQTSSTPSTSPSPAGGLVDGRYFIYPKKVKGGSVTFDVATFLTGKAAADAAKAHGDESPPPNDYYIVNDSKALSTYPVSTSVVVRYVPATNCCNLQVGDFSAWGRGRQRDRDDRLRGQERSLVDHDHRRPDTEDPAAVPALTAVQMKSETDASFISRIAVAAPIGSSRPSSRSSRLSPSRSIVI